MESVKSVLHILKLFLPLPIYWALLAQQDSSWTFQATKMNTRIGGWRIEPDQMKAVAPLILLGLIPLWDKIVLPFVHRNTNMVITPITSITLGGIAAAGSFVCSGFLEEIIQVSCFIFCYWKLIKTILIFVVVLLLLPAFRIQVDINIMAVTTVCIAHGGRTAAGHSGHSICFQGGA